MSELTYFTVDDRLAGKRVDVALAELAGITRSAAQKAIADERLYDGAGNPVAKSMKVEAGQRFGYIPAEVEPVELQPLDVDIEIVYEDDDIAVVNKPRGMVVHPAAGHAQDTLVNVLMARLSSLSGINGELRPGIVHRIDKDTSGLLVVAKNDMAHQSLAAQIKAHTARRTYETIVRGRLRDDAGTVDAPIGRSKKDRKKQAVVSDGRDAVTHWQVIERYAGWTYVRCVLETGRTHQIRVHMAHIGHPVAGDPLYGGHDELKIGGQCLHARELELNHPRTGERMKFVTELPDYFAKVLTKLGKSVE